MIRGQPYPMGAMKRRLTPPNRSFPRKRESRGGCVAAPLPQAPPRLDSRFRGNDVLEGREYGLEGREYKLEGREYERCRGVRSIGQQDVRRGWSYASTFSLSHADRSPKLCELISCPMSYSRYSTGT